MRFLHNSGMFRYFQNQDNRRELCMVAGLILAGLTFTHWMWGWPLGIQAATQANAPTGGGMLAPSLGQYLLESLPLVTVGVLYYLGRRHGREIPSSSAAQSKPLVVFVSMDSLSIEPKSISPGKTLKIGYVVESSADVPSGIWLGASLWYKNGKSFWNVHQDKPVVLLKGTHEYDRDLTIPADAPLGNHRLGANVWHGVLSEGNKSVRLTKGGRVEIAIVA
jgi:hypothetical protein